MDRGYYSEKNAINIVKQILSAVAYLHGAGIAHRDLKVNIEIRKINIKPLRSMRDYQLLIEAKNIWV